CPAHVAPLQSQASLKRPLTAARRPGAQLLRDHRLTRGEAPARPRLAASPLRLYEHRRLIASVPASGRQRRPRRHVPRRLPGIQAAQRVGLSLDEIRGALATLPEDRAPTAAQWERLASSWRPLLDARIRLLESLRDDLNACIGCGCLSLGICRMFNPADR